MINSIKCSGQVGLVLENGVLTSDKKFKAEVINDTLVISNASNSTISIDGICISNSFINNENSSIIISGNNISISSNNGNVSINGKNISSKEDSSSNEEAEGLLEYDLKNQLGLLGFITLSGQSALDIVDPILTLKNIDLSGQSNLRIKEVSSDIRISVSGQSEVVISNMTSKETTIVESTGQSEVKFKNSVFNSLFINASGMSSVKLRSCTTNNLQKSSTGMSKVSIK